MNVKKLITAIFIVLFQFSTLLQSETVLVDFWNKQSVSNWPSELTMFQLNSPVNISYIDTYHWNNGKGSTGNEFGAYIKLKEIDSGKTYGPWKAELKGGSLGAKNVHWVVYPDIVLPAGIYVIFDSDPATWSHNSASNGMGFAKVSTGKVQRHAEIKKVEYLGCFKDTSSRDLNSVHFQDSKMNTQLCTDTCYNKGYKFAATQYSEHCFCANEYGKYGATPDCTMKCSGDSSQICGGSWANSVYKVK